MGRSKKPIKVNLKKLIQQKGKNKLKEQILKIRVLNQDLNIMIGDQL